MVQNIFKKEKSLSEIEEESEKVRAEDELEGVKLSLAQKRLAAQELKARGLKPSNFGGNWSRIVQWLKTH